jgi:hypothetical protein
LVNITTYRQTDPVGIPRRLFEALRAFDGRPISDVRKEIERDFGLELTDDLLVRLADFEVLVPGSEPIVPAAT